MNVHPTDPFEDQLRTVLREAGEATPDLGLSTQAVLGAGARVVRRRRLAAAAGAAAAASLIAVGTYTAFSSGAQRTTNLPATQGPSASESRIADQGVLVATLTRPDTLVGSGPALGGPRTIVVTVNTDPSARQNISYAVDGQAMGSSVSLSPTTYTWGSDGGSFIVGVRPARVLSDVVLAPTTPGLSSGARKPLGSTGLEAFATWFPEGFDGSSVTDMVWCDEDGGVFDTSASVVPSLTVGNGQRVYYSPALDIFGACGGEFTASIRPSEVPKGRRAELGPWRGTGSGWTGLYAVPVDRGAANPVVTPASGVAVTNVAFVDVAGQPMVAALLSAPSKPSGVGVQSVSWGVAGRTVTYVPGTPTG